MRNRSASSLALLFAFGLTILTPLAAWQKKSDQKTATSQQDKDKDKKESDRKDDKAAPPDGGDKPKPLFQGKMQLKSSQRGADTATAGFNGLDKDGKVTKEALAGSPTAADSVNAQSLVAFAPTPEELQQFLDEGKLIKAQPKTETKTESKDKD